jgi:DNA-binding transcriptional MerR regulator
MMERAMLKIGEVAARSGVSIDTLRYYERLGLLPKPVRTSSGYRLYEARMVDRLAFIKRAQSFGFRLDEIKQMLHLETADPQTCSRVLEMIEHKLEVINHQYEEIKRLRRELSAYKTECERALANRQCCPVIEDFVQPPHRPHKGGK